MGNRTRAESELKRLSQSPGSDPTTQYIGQIIYCEIRVRSDPYETASIFYFFRFLPSPIAFSIFFNILLATLFAFSAPSSRTWSNSSLSIKL
jgi:hypothetical protein